MKSLVILAVILGTILDVSQVQSASTLPPTDAFIALIKEIEQSDFFPLLDSQNRKLTFEMLTAAETGNLEQLLDLLGYVTLLEYPDALPKSYQHRFITYSVAHLGADYAARLNV